MYGMCVCVCVQDLLTYFDLRAFSRIWRRTKRILHGQRFLS